MPKFYTQAGDDGYTGLLGEGRVAKYDARPEALGTLDEASAALGLARASCVTAGMSELLIMIQRDLYDVMAEVGATPEQAARFRKIDAGRVNFLEQKTDQVSGLVNLPKEFILPGDTPGGAALSLARTIVRRAERRVAQLLHTHQLENQQLLRYLNRLSSLCFVLELWENQSCGKDSPTLARTE